MDFDQLKQIIELLSGNGSIASIVIIYWLVIRLGARLDSWFDRKLEKFSGSIAGIGCLARQGNEEYFLQRKDDLRALMKEILKEGNGK